MSSLGQLLMTGVPGPVLDAQTAAAFRRIQPGAFILFGRNIQSPAQLRKLCDDLRDLSHVEPIITIDQEGGRVSRLKLIGNEPPNANQLRDRDDLSLITAHGRITGRLLRSRSPPQPNTVITRFGASGRAVSRRFRSASSVCA